MSLDGSDTRPRVECKRQGRISADTSEIPVWVIPTDEERLIARHTMHVLGSELLMPASAARARGPV